MRTSDQIYEALKSVIKNRSVVGLAEEYNKDITSLDIKNGIISLQGYKQIHSKWKYSISRLNKELNSDWASENLFQEMVVYVLNENKKFCLEGRFQRIQREFSKNRLGL